MKKIFILFICLLFIETMLIGQAAYAQPEINAQAYILIDADNGQVLLEQEADKKLNPASTTKILTAILALEQAKLDDEVIISKNVSLVQGTKVYLREGEKLSLEVLLNGMLIHSANDAAVAIAEHISGSEEKFAILMNKKAEEIGAKDSNFLNPHGMTEEGHLTTAHDLALIGQYAMQNEVFRKIVLKKVYDWEGEEWQTRLINKNELLWNLKSTTGIKNGYTDSAHYTLVAAAEENDRELIAVILGSPNAKNLWENAKNLLEFGFAHFQMHKIADKDQIVATLNMENGHKVDLIPSYSGRINLAIDQEFILEKTVQLNEIKLPIKDGDILGNLIVNLDGQEIKKIPLQAQGGFKRKVNWSRFFINLLAGLFLVQIINKLARNLLKKRRRRRSFQSANYLKSTRF